MNKTPIVTGAFCMPGGHSEPVPEGDYKPEGWTLEPATSIGGQWYVNRRHPAPSTKVPVCPDHFLHDYHDDIDGCFPGCPAWNQVTGSRPSVVSEVNQYDSVTEPEYMYVTFPDGVERRCRVEMVDGMPTTPGLSSPEWEVVEPYTLHYTSADGPGNDATWSVYREKYKTSDAEVPIDGTQEHVSTHPTEAEADAEAIRLQAETGGRS